MLDQRVAQKARDVCLDVLANQLSFDEFYNSWPKEAADDEFLRQVFDDLEDAVEHTPGSFFRRGRDYQLWRASEY